MVPTCVCAALTRQKNPGGGLTGAPTAGRRVIKGIAGTWSCSVPHLYLFAPLPSNGGAGDALKSQFSHLIHHKVLTYPVSLLLS